MSAPDDPQNRCSNCIRLKKECNFYPVDQQPTQERRSRTGSKVEVKAGTNSTSASSSSSPGLTVGSSADHVENFNHFPLMPIATNPFTTPLIPSAAVAMSPPGSAGKPALCAERQMFGLTVVAAPFSTRFEFPDQQPRSHWEPQYYESPVGHPDEHSHGFWMKPDTPITPSYPTYHPTMPAPPNPQVHHESTYPPYEAAKTESGWHPNRSMSYSHLEETAHPHEAFNQFYHPEARRNTLDMLPPSLRHSGSSSIVSISESPATTLPATTTMQTLPPQPVPLPWQHSMPPQSPKSLDFGGAWYPDPGHLTKVSEEQEPPPHFVGDQSLLYSGAHQ